VRPLDPRLLRYAAAARSFLAIGAVLGVVQTLCVVAVAWYASRAVVAA
jgi:ATP-binding cassette subfamily C protein CydD